MSRWLKRMSNAASQALGPMHSPELLDCDLCEALGLLLSKAADMPCTTRRCASDLVNASRRRSYRRDHRSGGRQGVRPPEIRRRAASSIRSVAPQAQ